MRGACIAALLCFAINGFAQSPKRPTHARDTENSKQRTTSPPNQTVAIYDQPSGKDNGETVSQHQQEIETQRELARFTGWLVAVGAVQAVVLILQAVLFFRQMKIMGQHRVSLEQLATAADNNAAAANQNADLSQKALTLASETAQKQLRAYICVDSALLKFKRPDVPEVQVHYSNCGQTPAYNVRTWIHMWIERHPLMVVLPVPLGGFQMSTSVLPPKGKPYVSIIEKEPPVPPQSIRLLGTPEGTIYVYGEIRYRDIFGNQQSTKYRLIHGGPGGIRTTTKDGIVTALLRPDTDGNEAT